MVGCGMVGGRVDCGIVITVVVGMVDVDAVGGGSEGSVVGGAGSVVGGAVLAAGGGLVTGAAVPVFRGAVVTTGG